MAITGRFLPEFPGACPGLPVWVPVPARQYLAHVSAGQSLRAIARPRGGGPRAGAAGEAPSTVSRRVRRLEGRRDDPLLDEGPDRARAFGSAPP